MIFRVVPRIVFTWYDILRVNENVALNMYSYKRQRVDGR